MQGSAGNNAVGYSSPRDIDPLDIPDRRSLPTSIACFFFGARNALLLKPVSGKQWTKKKSPLTSGLLN